MLKTLSFTRMLCLTAVMAAACTNYSEPKETAQKSRDSDIMKATAELSSIGKSTVIGIASFEETDSGLTVSIDLNGLEIGDYRLYIDTSEDCQSAQQDKNGKWDLGIFQPNDEGRAHIETSLDSATLSKNKSDSVIRKALMVASNDELETQLACGTIQTGERNLAPMPAFREGSGWTRNSP